MLGRSGVLENDKIYERDLSEKEKNGADMRVPASIIVKYYRNSHRPWERAITSESFCYRLLHLECTDLASAYNPSDKLERIRFTIANAELGKTDHGGR